MGQSPSFVLFLSGLIVLIAGILLAKFPEAFGRSLWSRESSGPKETIAGLLVAVFIASGLFMIGAGLWLAFTSN